MSDDDRFLTVVVPDLDILVFAPAAEGSVDSVSKASVLAFERAAEQDLHLALIRLEPEFLAPLWPELVFSGEPVTCLRSCLMKPEHLDWLEAIWERMVAALGRGA